jgi:probable HAF family extracellular repeat protein
MRRKGDNMKFKRVISLFVVSFLSVLAVELPAQQQQATPEWKAKHARYAIIDLGAVGTPPGQPYFLAENGLVAGAVVAANGPSQAVIWQEGPPTDIGAPGLGGPNSIAFGANKRDAAVGQADSATADPNGEDYCGFKALGLPSYGTSCLPFLWKDGAISALPLLRDSDGKYGNNGEANQINNRGEVVGSAENSTFDSSCSGPSVSPQMFQFKPVIWKKGKIRELPTFSDDPDGVAFGINDKGQVVGASGSCTSFNVGSTLTNLLGLHALLWEDGTATDLGNLGGTNPPAPGHNANAISNRGQVVGDSFLADNATFHAFLWTKDSGMQDLGTLPGDLFSFAASINDRGQAVGGSLDANFNERPVLWEDGVPIDINTLILADSPLHLVHACGINSRGQISGFGVTSTGEVHGYLATPYDRDGDDE